VEIAFEVKPLTTTFPQYVVTLNDIVQFNGALSSFAEPGDSEPDSPHWQQDCSPWIPATHPDGALYFYDEERVRVPMIVGIPSHADAPLKRLFTDTDMHNSIMRDEIEEFYNHLQRVIHIDQLSVPSNDHDLVLDIMPTVDGRISWSYYYVCHETRCLFWLETYDAGHMVSEVFGVKSPAHVSALHSSPSEYPADSINVVCRASFGVPLLVGLLSQSGLVS
jgi:hypothetical protein